MTLTGAGTVAAVIGSPIAHSKSPQLHQYWLERYSVDGAVVPLAVDPADLGDALRAMMKIGFAGTSVTIPHKETCIPLLDDVSPLVRSVGACNMIIMKNGKLIGDNTDVFGFSENLRLGAGGADLKRKSLVLGAGGAARAVVAGLADVGVTEIVIVNRTEERAQKLVSDMAPHMTVPLSAIGWNEIPELLPGIGVLINATSLGMTGQPPLQLDLNGLQPGSVVNDIVYQPLETELLRTVAKRGCITVDGLGMLLHQARPAFRAWFGVDPEVGEKQRALILGTQ